MEARIESKDLVRVFCFKETMPLIRSSSKKAFSSNMKAEMSAGKPQKQSLAIAFSKKRKAQVKRKHSEASYSKSTGISIRG